MADPELSGKVFRFLSAMHPSLSKSERKRYAGYDPESWYPWTPEVAAEFTDLMRRSPRDTSFARGFAYAAQKAIPEGAYVPTPSLIANLARLPAAYRGPDGSGYAVDTDGERNAKLRYTGMQGFTNVCIAITGELEQRLKDSGAVGPQIRHGKLCRLHGGEACEFEVSWSDESRPANATEADLASLLNSTPGADATGAAPDAKPTADAPERGEPLAARGSADEDAAAAPTGAVEPPPEPPRRTMAAAARAAEEQRTGLAPSDAIASNEDLFATLRTRLDDAEAQASLHADLEATIARLEGEVEEARSDATHKVDAARAEAAEARAQFADLKRQIRALVSED